MKRFVALLSAAALLLGVGLVLAAEVQSVEVVAGVDNTVIEVQQGQTVGFTIRVTAPSGNLKIDITEANPSTVTVHTYYQVVASSGTPSSPCSFWADTTTGSGNARPAAPSAGYEVNAFASASAGAVPGDYVIRIQTAITNPPYTPQLEDNHADYLTLRVVAAGPPPDTQAPTGGLDINGGALYTNNPGVTLNLSATDNVGVARHRVADGTDASGGTVLTVNPAVTPFTADVPWTLPAGDGLKTVAVQYGDAAGNWSGNYTASITLDTTDPVVTITAPLDRHYYQTAPPLGYTVNDNLDPSPAVLTSGYGTTEGVHTVTVTATDWAGNVGTASATYTVDNTVPVITITAPVSGFKYLLNQVVLASYGATDNLSGVATLSGTVADGSPIDTSTAGAKTFSVAATDNAGNSAQAEPGGGG